MRNHRSSEGRRGSAPTSGGRRAFVALLICAVAVAAIALAACMAANRVDGGTDVELPAPAPAATQPATPGGAGSGNAGKATAGQFAAVIQGLTGLHFESALPLGVAALMGLVLLAQVLVIFGLLLVNRGYRVALDQARDDYRASENKLLDTIVELVKPRGMA
ncbi:hypothetical protein RAS1_42250 [Phycisphaerae bacterium RAS1]|nr:hypothetical protein RAS1_42250 [Phycisphaerae bacterium RAS1]